MASSDIGCSLAEAADSAEYTRYLQAAAHTPNSLHVVYINTSLRTKATAHSLVPTITCTSSNVVQTILQGFAQVCISGVAVVFALRPLSPQPLQLSG
jgi:quinolinate synthase